MSSYEKEHEKLLKLWQDLEKEDDFIESAELQSGSENEDINMSERSADSESE